MTGEATGMRRKKRLMNNWCRWSLLSGIVTVGGPRRGVTLSPEDLALSFLVYEQLLSRLAQAFVVCGAVLCGEGVGEGASTPSAFLYATMTVLSRAVSPHQQPCILIAQPKSQSKPHPHHNQSNQRMQQAAMTNYHQVALKVGYYVAVVAAQCKGLYNAGTPCCAVNAALRA